MKNAGMAGAVALVGIGLITIGLSNFANRAEAVPSAIANPGPGEPVIVAFGSLGLARGDSHISGYPIDAGFYRVWSDGRIEMRLLGIRYLRGLINCNGALLDSDSACGHSETLDSGWLTLPEPPGGNGFACRSDINGDRNVDSADLGLLIAQWGEDVSCDPQPSYPCFDLTGLNLNMAAR